MPGYKSCIRYILAANGSLEMISIYLPANTNLPQGLRQVCFITSRHDEGHSAKSSAALALQYDVYTELNGLQGYATYRAHQDVYLRDVPTERLFNEMRSVMVRKAVATRPLTLLGELQAFCGYTVCVKKVRLRDVRVGYDTQSNVYLLSLI